MSRAEVMRGCGPDVRELIHDDQPTACVGDAADMKEHLELAD